MADELAGDGLGAHGIYVADVGRFWARRQRHYADFAAVLYEYVARMLAHDAQVREQVARRLQKLSRGRNARAHPDPTLLDDLGAFNGCMAGGGNIHV